MAKDFTLNIQDSIKNKDEKVILDIKESSFKIGKKKESKISKKSLPLYVEDVMLKQLDGISKKTGHSRNEIITKMIQHCLDTIEFE